MVKAHKCDWCGEEIAATDNRVRLPMVDATSAFRYHDHCYVYVYQKDVRAILAKYAPVPPPAPAPVTTELDPEQPATPAPTPPPETPSASVPDAGDVYTAPSGKQIADAMDKARTFAGLHIMQMECRSMSRELQVLDELEQMDDAGRERVLQYAVSRWWLMDVKGAGQ